MVLRSVPDVPQSWESSTTILCQYLSTRLNWFLQLQAYLKNPKHRIPIITLTPVDALSLTKSKGYIFKMARLGFNKISDIRYPKAQSLKYIRIKSLFLRISFHIFSLPSPSSSYQTGIKCQSSWRGKHVKRLIEEGSRKGW